MKIFTKIWNKNISETTTKIKPKMMLSRFCWISEIHCLPKKDYQRCLIFLETLQPIVSVHHFA